MNGDRWAGTSPAWDKDVESEAVHHVHGMGRWMHEFDHERATSPDDMSTPAILGSRLDHLATSALTWGVVPTDC